MMTLSTSHSFQNLSQIVRGCPKLSTGARETESLHVRVTHWKSDKLTVKLICVVPWEIVGDQVIKRVLGDGSWAGLSRVSSLPPIFFVKLHSHH